MGTFTDQSPPTLSEDFQGQGGGQQRLLHFCEQSTIDIIPIGFIHIFPQQGNGFPGSNFANQCWGGTYVYPGPGPNPSLDQLQSSCPQLVADIPICQSVYGKKIILSLGGGTNTYQLSGAANGETFADFLWGAFGPKTSAWISRGLPRPFESSEVDGFDFDIETPSPGNAFLLQTKLFPDAVCRQPSWIHCHGHKTTSTLPNSDKTIHPYRCTTMRCRRC